MVASPKHCLEEVKRREMLIGVAKSSPCIFQNLLFACDALLLLGGHGIDQCGLCTHNAVGDGHWKSLRPLPSTFHAATQLGVSCNGGYSGSDLGRSDQSESESLCVDGHWFDSKGRRGLSHFECETCVQASRPGLRTFIQSNRQETWFMNKHGKEIRSGAGRAAESCLTPNSDHTVEMFSASVSFQGLHGVLPSGHVRDDGSHYRKRGNLRYGWLSQSQGPCDFTGGIPVAFRDRKSVV